MTAPGPNSLPCAAITGLGLVSPLGSKVDDYWLSLTSGRSGIGRISCFDPGGFAVQIGGEVKGFDSARFLPAERSRQLPTAARHAVAAAKAALSDSGLDRATVERERIDVYLGVSCPDMAVLTKSIVRKLRRGPGGVSPRCPGMIVPSAAATAISRELGLLGETVTVSSGCSSSTDALGRALRAIRLGTTKVALAGGADTGIEEITTAAFGNAGKLSTRNSEPAAASRPFDINRDGLVLSDGAAIVVVEEYQHARARRANIYAELRGYASLNSSGWEGRGGSPSYLAALCMREAMRDARLCDDSAEYHCAHGSSTPFADAHETTMLKLALKSHAYRLHVSSIKSMMGHPLGACGAFQTITCALVIARGAIPPTINYEEPDPDCDLDYVPNDAREARVRVTANYAMGIGGNHSVLIVTALGVR